MKFSRFIPRSRTPGLPPYGEQDPNTFENGYRPSPPPGAITPYLGLRSRLSQIWFNRWTILLLLILARVLIAIGSLDGNLTSAKREALSACSSVESVGSAMASMPHYMSRGVNELTASGVEKAVNGLMSMLELTITGVEEIFVFFVNVMTSTYVCLITLVVAGMMNAAIEVLKKATEFLDDIVGKIGEGISDGVDFVENALNGVRNTINLLGADIPKVDLSGPIKELEDLSLPDSLTDDLDKLKEKIPNFEEVNNFTNNALRTPFELVKKLIRDEIDEYTFDRSIFPVPPKEQLSFCNDDDGIHSFFNKLASFIGTAKKIFIGVLVVGAILVCVPMAYREIRAWHGMKERSSLVRRDAHDPMDVVYIVSRPFASTAGLKAASRFSAPRRQVLVRWIVAYVTSPPALFLLSLGVAGLFSCACQAILLRAVKNEVPGLTDHVSKFAEKVVFALNNASEQWAIGTNRVIDDTNNDINQKVFGWVNQTTGSVNNTLNIFVDETSNLLNRTFGGTILYEPIKDVLHCLIGLKIEGIQKGLTWVSEHAHVDFPNMPKDTFSLGAIEKLAGDNDSTADSFIANPGDKTADKIGEVVQRVTDSVESGIRTEAIISGVIISIWFAVLLMAIIRALTLWFGPDKTRGDGNGDSEFPHPDTLPRDAAGFSDIPLATPTHVHPGMVDRSAPVCSTRHDSPGQGFNRAHDAEDYYQEQKLGFAGQRELRRDGGGHSRESSYGEVEYVNDVKR
ncbi:plasma membrane fusion protein PRM1 [Blastomyces dermatitidis ATCC 18188]|uniref:Plasma membrane fusion protein PRM1 n=1 Tax=Ajellomyces dermatitidis (strain ATCC 18188 / CBS 674.68) TaxID=653446 RepID=F2T7V0_AJEDA|nr:plasma membrane fusion protein PRM1 [Blastomyces dermatitidis ATCC 18188]